MLQSLSGYFNNFFHLIYPHFCEGCGSDALSTNHILCASCLADLPETGFSSIEENVIEKRFYGRLKLHAATAAFYFTQQSLMQHLMHQLKYKGNKQVGIYLGKLLGEQIKTSNRFNEVDVIIPLPLNPKREFKRGYNQATMIAQGVAEALNKPIIENAVVREVFTSTQTKQDRIHRFKNMDGVFATQNKAAINNKHILLIDDIITTGATIEACANIIIQQNCKALSVASVAYTA